jgi:antitoxin (DNA-binding transcriptional repressor) of toxin-antitoxin stability system
MRVVGIKQLKARLSAYLREVRRGEVFLVTDRDEVIAELRPARTTLPHAEGAAAALEELAASGDVAAPRRAKADWTWQPRGAGLSADVVGALLDELRADRFAGPG